MNWFYAIGDKQTGPVTEDQFRQLIEAGVVTGETLVWREGMSGWQPLSQAAPDLAVGTTATPPPPPVGEPLGQAAPASGVACQECGRVFPVSEMVRIGGANVCADCKPTFLQKVREGIATGNRGAELERLLKIAKAQRGVNLGLLLMLLCYGMIFMFGFLGGATTAGGGQPSAAFGILSFIAMAGYIAVLVMQLIYVYRLAAALDAGSPVLWLLGVMCLSCIGLILLLILSSKATKALRAGGFKVGLLGGNPRDIEAAMGR